MREELVYAIVAVVYLLYGYGYALAKADKFYQAVLATLFWPFFKDFEDGGGFG